jgi:hypothetical protein
MRYSIALILPLITASVIDAQPPSDFTPPPSTVTRYESAYRFPQAGWIALHIEGEPYERGVQHGRLLASEIAAYLRCFALTLDHEAPYKHWRHVRTLVDALFLRKFEPEFLQEMKGIADGASAMGVKFDDRAIDVIDIAAINCWTEIESLAAANAATPTGLEGMQRKHADVKLPPRFERCSAFAATGPATADGKIVFGHATFTDLYPANFCNVWLDVKPAKGRRFVMCCFPGGIQSGMDYYLNDAGILISETTLAQTSFHINGMTCASRIRKAIQYADTIDQAVDFLTRDSNGLYTNEWLLADINTNEIAMLQLGTHKHKLWRSSKNEWFGDTPGFYWSCNTHKDIEVCLETIPSAKALPSKVVFRPSDRDQTWVKLYEKQRGKIGRDFIAEFCASPVLADASAVDCKFTTPALAKQLKSWASFGPPSGKPRTPSDDEKKYYPEIKMLTKHDWTLLGTTAPANHPANVTLKAKVAEAKPDLVWRGTVLPKADGDIWLALAFADYHTIVRMDQADQANALQECHTEFEKARKVRDSALADIRQTAADDAWYRLAAAKGTLLLHRLRSELRAAVFDAAMDAFGQTHGGEPVTSLQFQRHMEKASGRDLSAFFTSWLRDKALPKESSAK